MLTFTLRLFIRPGLLGTILILTLLAAPQARAQQATSTTQTSAKPQPIKKTKPARTAKATKNARPAARTTQSDSLIEIHFADPALPDIRVTGVTSPEPYGIHYTEEEQRARDQAALNAPPPDPSVYEINWQSHEDFDVERLRQAAEAGRSWTGYGWSNNGWSDYGVNVYPFTTFGTASGSEVGGAFHLTPSDSYPRFNLLEYNAALADWQRGQERAALHGAKTAAAKQ